ncbi:MAG: winged helix-turn-helix domain-containing protein [Candidatus Hydrogenedens sp.]
MKTPERAYVLPVVDSLMEFGGTAPRKEVVTRVFEKMKHILKDYDLEPMSYNKYVPRWKDTLHWVRLHLLERGILEKGTEKGIWTLTEYGKAYYAMHKDRTEEKKEVDIPPYSEKSEEMTSEGTFSAPEKQEENIEHNISEPRDILNQ